MSNERTKDDRRDQRDLVIIWILTVVVLGGGGFVFFSSLMQLPSEFSFWPVVQCICMFVALCHFIYSLRTRVWGEFPFVGDVVFSGAMAAAIFTVCVFGESWVAYLHSFF